MVQARYNVYKSEGKHGEEFHFTRKASGKRSKDNKVIENSVDILSGTDCVVE